MVKQFVQKLEKNSRRLAFLAIFSVSIPLALTQIANAQEANLVGVASDQVETTPGDNGAYTPTAATSSDPRNTASITADQIDPNPSNNTSGAISLAALTGTFDLTKTATTSVDGTTGEILVSYTLTATNNTNEDVNNFTLTDDLVTNLAGIAIADWSVENLSATGLTANTSYNGGNTTGGATSDTQLLATSQTLAAAGSVTVTFDVRIAATASGSVSNQATAGGTHTGGTALNEPSDDPATAGVDDDATASTLPLAGEFDLTKTATTSVDGTTGEILVSYTLTATNNTNEDVNNFTLTDDLVTNLAGIAIADWSVENLSATGLTANTSYNGGNTTGGATSDTQLLATSQTLAAAGSVTVTFDVRIAATASGSVSNQATAGGTHTGGAALNEPSDNPATTGVDDDATASTLPLAGEFDLTKTATTSVDGTTGEILVSYTLTATNGTNEAISNFTLTDDLVTNLAGIAIADWSVENLSATGLTANTSYNGGNTTGGATSDTQLLATSQTLAAAGSVTVTFDVRIAATASGSVSNQATAGGTHTGGTALNEPSDDPATAGVDDDATASTLPLAGEFDLTKTATTSVDGTTGEILVSYTLTATNNTNEDVNNFTLTDDLVTNLAGIAIADWSVENLSATGLTANTSYNGGNTTGGATSDTQLLATSQTLAAAGSVTVTFDVRIAATASGSVSNQATAGGTHTGGAALNEPSDNPATTGVDDDATASTLPLAGEFDLTKTATTSVDGTTGEILVSYTLTATNGTNEAISNFTLTDDLVTNLAGIAIADWSVENLSATGLTANTSYNGGNTTGGATSDTQLLATSQTLAAAGSVTVTFDVRIAATASGSVSNQATAGGTHTGGTALNEPSDDPATTGFDDDATASTLPLAGEFDLTKTATTSVDGTTGEILVSYTLTATNNTNEDVNNFSLIDNLVTNLTGIAIADWSVENLSATGLTANTSYDGGKTTGNDDLIAASQTMAIGASITVTFDVRIAATASGSVSNQATAGGTHTGGTALNEPSDDPATIGINGDATVITLSDPVRFTKVSSSAEATLGQPMAYVLEAENLRSVSVTVDVVDFLPAGFNYEPDTAMISNPAGSSFVAAEPTTSGSNLVWPGVTLAPNSTAQITIVVIPGVGLNSGTYTNTACTQLTYTGNAADCNSNLAGAPINVSTPAVFGCSSVMGQVFFDADADGYLDLGESGATGVRIGSTDGFFIRPDAHGRFSVPCAAEPGNAGSNYILKLDEATLPAGYHVTSENPRVVRVMPGSTSTLNFGIGKGCSVQINLSDNAFVADSAQLFTQWQPYLDRVLSTLAAQQNEHCTLTTRIRSCAGGDSSVGADRARALGNYLNQQWQSTGGRALNTEVEVWTTSGGSCGADNVLLPSNMISSLPVGSVEVDPRTTTTGSSRVQVPRGFKLFRTPNRDFILVPNPDAAGYKPENMATQMINLDGAQQVLPPPGATTEYDYVQLPNGNLYAVPR